jgi:hypothetical protein
LIHNVDFDAWIGYLISANLVTKEGPSTYKISNKGTGFLNYIDVLGLPARWF